MELSEVISRIKDHIKVHFENEKRHHPPVKITEALNIAVDLLEKQRWHYPSNGELPNEGNLVFVAGKNQNGYKWTGCLYYREDNYDERTGFYDDDSTCFDDEVYAWQYLPEPPKEIA